MKSVGEPFGDLHIFDTLASAWKDLTLDVAGDVPSPRALHGATVAMGKFYICYGASFTEDSSGLKLFAIGEWASQKLNSMQ